MRELAASDAAGLRRFALGAGFLIAVLFGALVPWLRARPHPAWPWIAAGLLALVGLAWPRGVYPLYRAWRPVARFLEVVNTWLLLTLAYLVVLVPLGFLLRATGRLQYRTGFDRRAASYRVPLARGRTTDLEEPF